MTPSVALGVNYADKHRDPAAVARVAAVAARVLARHGVDPASARRAPGWSTLTWLADGLAVRVAASPGPDDLLREARLAARLPRAVGYPRLVDAGTDDGHEWQLTEEVRGANLRELWPKLTWDDRERAALELWQRARAAHAVEHPEADSRSHSPVCAPTPEAAEAQVAALERRGVLAPDQCAVLRAALESFWAALPAGRRVLCHGDLCVANAIWRDGRVVCLLDFEVAVAAPVELDAHRLLQGIDALPDDLDDLEGSDPQPDPTGAAQRRLLEAAARSVRSALGDAGWPERARGYAVLFQLWSMLGWLKHWEPGEDYTEWLPFRKLTALASGSDAYLAPLLASA